MPVRRSAKATSGWSMPAVKSAGWSVTPSTPSRMFRAWSTAGARAIEPQRCLAARLPGEPVHRSGEPATEQVDVEAVLPGALVDRRLSGEQVEQQGS